MFLPKTTTADTIYIWIVDYAFRHRIDDVIFEFFKGIEERTVTRNMMSKISILNLNQALIWLRLTYEDRKWTFGSLLDTLDFMCQKVVASNIKSLELSIRLSLGLKLKDLTHNLHLAPNLFLKKLVQHFPNWKFEFEKEYLSLVFSESELEEFELTVQNVCNYLSTLNSSENEKRIFLKNLNESEFGTVLTDSLKTMTVELFEQLFDMEPLCILEQIVESKKAVPESQSYWSKWLIDKLSGIEELDPNIVRMLLIELEHEKDFAASKSNQDVDGENSVADIIKTCEDSTDSERSFVPSSHGNENSETAMNKNGENSQKGYNTPDLKQFIKQECVRGCIIRMDKIGDF